MGRRSIAAVTLAGLSLFLLSGSLQAQNDLPVVFYSAPQAQAGRAVYHQQCSSCHSDSLAGEHGPPLKGDMFWQVWDQKKARKLYSLILSSMPVGHQGSLSEKEVLAIIAYILEVNGLQPGDQSIDSADQLNKVKLQRPVSVPASPAQ